MQPANSRESIAFGHCYTFRMKRLILLVCIILTAAHHSLGQGLPGHRFTDFIRSNDAFGQKLFAQVHGVNVNENTVISPLPVYYILGAITRGSTTSAMHSEIEHALDWDNSAAPIGPSRLLFERFRPAFSSESTSSPEPRGDKQKTYVRSSLTRSQEAMWMATAFIYRGADTIYDTFMHEARNEFGMHMVDVAQQDDLQPAVDRWWTDYVPKPTIVGPTDFYALGMMHLQTAWAGNTFSKGNTHVDNFTLRSGAHELIDVMPSEMSLYPHVRTNAFEAVMLRCYAINLLVVLPAEGKDILQLENELANDPGKIDPVLMQEPGAIDLPKFRFHLESDLRPALEMLGVHRIFTDLDVVKIPKSHCR